MVYMVVILAEDKNIEEARRLAFQFCNETQPGHKERLERMLPTPLCNAETGELTHWICFIRMADESRVAAIAEFRDKNRPPMSLHVLGPTPRVRDGESLRHKTDAALDAWLAPQGLVAQSVKTAT